MKDYTTWIVVFSLILLLVVSASGRPWWLRDIRAFLPRHRKRRYDRRRLDQIERIVIHHTGGPADATPQDIARYHVAADNHICDDGCPGIAYHFMVDLSGRAYQVNDLETVSYHVGGNNTPSVGIALIGDYNVLEPTAKQLQRVRGIIRYVERKVGRKLDLTEHRDFKNTTCPGANVSLGQISKEYAA